MSATETAINGAGFNATGTPIPKPKTTPKILDARGDTVHPSTMTTKNPNVIQIPQWAATTFGTFVLVIGFYAISFYNQTNNEIKNLTEKYNVLNSAQEEKRKQELQEMLNNAVKRGYELKSAEGDHGKEKR